MRDDFFELIANLADPQVSNVAPEAVEKHEEARLFEALRLHNVEPVALHKLRSLPLEARFAPGLCSAWKDHLYMRALVSALSGAADNLTRAFADADLPFRVVKGARFAHDLYPAPAQRPFSDIDILVPMAARHRHETVLRDLGYHKFERAHFDKSGTNEEQKWGLDGNDLILCELHTNLVHLPALRRCVSLSYEDLSRANGDGALPLAGHFVVAVLHASAGHKFHNLRLLVDVLQAARHLGDDDIVHLRQQMPTLRMRPEVLESLHLVSGLFPAASHDSNFMRIFDALAAPDHKSIVRPVDVFNAPYERSAISKLRRHAFRYHQITFAKRT